MKYIISILIIMIFSGCCTKQGSVNGNCEGCLSPNEVCNHNYQNHNNCCNRCLYPDELYYP